MSKPRIPAVKAEVRGLLLSYFPESNEFVAVHRYIGGFSFDFDYRLVQPYYRLVGANHSLAGANYRLAGANNEEVE